MNRGSVHAVLSIHTVTEEAGHGQTRTATEFQGLDWRSDVCCVARHPGGI